MLTDYHLHLRPDEPGTPGESFFTGENVDRYLAAAHEAGIEELGVSEHVYRFTQALDLWRHPFWEEEARDDLDAYCEFVRGTPLRLGIECDFVPGAEDRTANLLGARDFDYVVGSVHFVGERAFIAIDDHAQHLRLALRPVVLDRRLERALGPADLTRPAGAFGNQFLDGAVDRVDARARIRQR